MSDDLLTSRETAEALGVSTSSIKRWAEEGVLACVLTAGKHRRFARAEVDRFRASVAHGAAEPDWVDALLDSSDTLEISGRLLQERASLGSWARVADRLGPVIIELGRRWASGEISVLDEHLASERLSRALARISESIPLSLKPPNALLTTAEGEEHTLGLSLVELTLRELGWRTLWAGRQMPTKELVRRLGTTRPSIRLLAVSASAASVDGKRLASQAARLGAACNALDIALVLGGSGRWPPSLRGAHRFTSLVALHDLARELPMRER